MKINRSIRTHFKTYLNKYKTDALLKSITVLVLGTGLAQFIPILISPVLTRIYTPFEFGVYGIFLAITSVLTPLSTFRYDMAIMLPKSITHAKYLALTSVLISSIFAILVLIVVIAVQFFGESLNLNLPLYNDWILLIPLSLLFIGWYQTLFSWNNKQRDYKLISSGRFVRSFLLALFSIVFGLFKFKSLGLIYAFLFSQIIEFLYIYFRSSFRIEKITKTLLKRIFISARWYLNFPKHSTLAALIQAASMQLPIIIINRFFSAALTGLYFHAHKIINMPIILVARAVGTVYFKDVSEALAMNNKEKITTLSFIIFQKLTLIIVPPLSVVAFFGKDIFSFVFGQEWIEAGTFAQIITPWIVFNFIATPFIFIYELLNKQKTLGTLNLVLLVLRITSLVVGYVIYKDAFISIFIFSIVSAVSYIIIIKKSFDYLKISLKRNYYYFFKVLIVTLMILSPLKLLF